MICKKIMAIISSAVMAVTSLVSVISVTAAGTRYEAESAVCSGVTLVSNTSCSGGKAAYLQSSGSITFTVSVSKGGLYDLNFVASGVGGDKTNNVAVDGESIGEFTVKNGVMSDGVVKLVYLSAGSHQVVVTASWGWIYLDYLEISESQSSQRDYYDVSKTLVNPNASLSAQRVMSFIADNYGENVISGQTCDDGLNGKEFAAIKNLTGEKPAILGMDLMRYTPTRVAKGDSCQTVAKAIEFSNANGIVELCWHWNAPDKYLKSGTDKDGNPRWWGGFYTENLNIDFSAIMDGTDKAGHDLLMADIDAIAVQLKKLEDADVPVLFRPLHEASGGWFWWGSDGSAAYIKLWKEMYDKLTNEYGLDNLIWVWNGQDRAWYPGDEYVDIIGEDIYPGKRVYNPQSTKFFEAAEYTSTNKIVALTENGCLFDVDKALETNTMWSWFCVWGGEFCVNGSNISEKYTESAMWKKVYQHENVITLSKMPNLKTYPVDEIPATSVTLSATSKILTVGDTFTLTATKTPSNSNEIPTWSSSNTSVVSVINGKCTAKVAGKATVKCTLANGRSASCTITVNSPIKLSAVTGLAKVGKTTKSCSVKWNAVSGAAGYQIYVTDANGKHIKTITAKSTSATVSGLTSGATYKFKVRAYKSSVYGAYSSVLTYTTSPAKTTGLAVSTFTNKSVTLKWNKVSGAKKYVVYKLDTATSTYKSCKTVTTNSAVVDGLSAGKSYKFKVRAMKSLDTTNYYGDYSAVVSAITKPSTPKITLKSGSKSLTASWKKISGAEGYQVTYSTSSSFANSKVCYAKGESTLSRKVTSLTGSKTYYVKIRAYKTYDGKKYYSGYSSVKSIKTAK